MKSTLNNYLLCILIFSSTFGVAQENEGWKLSKSKNEISVFTKKENTSDFKAFKAVATIDKSIEKIEAFLKNYDNYPNWNFKCYKSEVLEKKGENNYLVHQFIDTPWPVSDRDVILNYEYKHYTNKTIITITSKYDKVPEEEDCIRIKLAEGKWELIKLADNKTKIIYQFLADPNGSLPSFVVNMFVVEGPIETISNLKNQL